MEGWLNSSPWRGGLKGTSGEAWLNSSRWRSAWWRLDEHEPVDEQSQVEAGGSRWWMNSSPWRLEEVDDGDEQYPVESRFAVRYRFNHSAPTQVCFLRFVVRHTPPNQQDPVSTVGGPTEVHFPPFCGTPDPSR